MHGRSSHIGCNLIQILESPTWRIIHINFQKCINETREVETHVVISDCAKLTIEHETKWTVSEVKKLATVVYDLHDMAASISSVTFKIDGMIIVLCSMKTMVTINNGYSSNLIHRAADVTLKERRKLLLVTRETPLSTTRLRNMHELSPMGVIVMPLMGSYYNQPETIVDVTNQMVGKILDSVDIEHNRFKR